MLESVNIYTPDDLSSILDDLFRGRGAWAVTHGAQRSEMSVQEIADSGLELAKKTLVGIPSVTSYKFKSKLFSKVGLARLGDHCRMLFDKLVLSGVSGFTMAVEIPCGDDGENLILAVAVVFRPPGISYKVSALDLIPTDAIDADQKSQVPVIRRWNEFCRSYFKDYYPRPDWMPRNTSHFYSNFDSIDELTKFVSNGELGEFFSDAIEISYHYYWVASSSVQDIAKVAGGDVILELQQAHEVLCVLAGENKSEVELKSASGRELILASICNKNLLLAPSVDSQVGSFFDAEIGEILVIVKSAGSQGFRILLEDEHGTFGNEVGEYKMNNIEFTLGVGI